MGVLSTATQFMNMKPEHKEMIAKFEPLLDMLLKHVWDPLNKKISETHVLAKENNDLEKENNAMLRSMMSADSFKFLVSKKIIKERR